MKNAEEFNEQTAKLSDEALLQKITDVNNSQLSHIGIMAYIELFNRNIYLRSILEEDNKLINELIEEDEKFKGIYDSIKSNVIELNNIKDIESINERLDIEELKNLRTSIVKVLRTLSAYSTEISYSNEIAKDLIYKDFIKENGSDLDKNIDYQKFFDTISKFVMEDPTNMKPKVMDITNILPMRVAKTKYYDIVSEAFKRNLKYSSKRKVDIVLARYKTLLNGSLETEYGLYFNRYFIKSQEARQVDFNTISKEELNGLYNDSYKTIMEIGTISNVIREFGIIINRLIAILILKDNIVDKFDNYNISPLTNSWVKYSEKSDKENRKKVLSEYKKIFDKLDSEFKDTNAKLQVLTMENFNRKNKVSDELKNELVTTQYILDFINDYALEQEEILEADYQNIVEKEYLNEAVKNLISFIDRNINSLEGLQRRTRMKRLLALTEDAFKSPKEFFEYVANSINMTKNSEDLIATINGILEIITRYRESGEMRI